MGEAIVLWRIAEDMASIAKNKLTSGSLNPALSTRQEIDISNLTIDPKRTRLKFNKGGLVPSTQDEQMLLEQAMAGAGGPDPMGGAPVDPVSGNPVPPGGTPEGVRDDVPANLSEGEFVLPAHVVRFIGVNTLMSLIEKAEEQIQMMEQGGMTGQPEMGDEEELPFGPEELEVEDTAGGMGGPPAPVNFNQGGLVADTSRAGQIEAPVPQAANMKIYKDANGFIRVVPVVDGVPLGLVEDNMTEVSSLAPRVSQPPEQKPAADGYQSPSENMVNIDTMSGQQARSNLEMNQNPTTQSAMKGLSMAVPGMKMAHAVQPAINQAYAGRVNTVEYGRPNLGLMDSLFGGTALGKAMGFKDNIAELGKLDAQREAAGRSSLASPNMQLDPTLGATPALERGMTTTPSLALDTSLSAAAAAQGMQGSAAPAAPSPGNFGLSDAGDPFGDDGKGGLW